MIWRIERHGQGRVLVNVFRQELLKFTRELDFTKYIRDAEIQSMIDQVKKRIDEIETKPEGDEDGDKGGSAEDGKREAEEQLEVCLRRRCVPF